MSFLLSIRMYTCCN